MITVIEKVKDDVLPFLKKDIFGIRIEANFNAYGTGQKFLIFWEQRDLNGSVTAVISSLDGDVTLYLSETADFEEINEFLFAVGAKTVFLDTRYDKYFSFRVKENGIIMKLNSNLSCSQKTEDETDFKKLFNLIFDKDNKVDFSFWFTDLSHKIRHGAADIKVLKIDGEPVACALAVFMTEEAALLGAVAVKEKYRLKGFGTLVVSALCEKMQKESKEVFLCRENNKNEEFYCRMGFENCGEWTMAGI